MLAAWKLPPARLPRTATIRLKAGVGSVCRSCCCRWLSPTSSRFRTPGEPASHEGRQHVRRNGTGHRPEGPGGSGLLPCGAKHDRQQADKAPLYAGCQGSLQVMGHWKGMRGGGWGGC